jgi:hypothetical protein
LLTAVPFLRRMTWRLPDTYHSAGHGRGTATLKFYEGRDILCARVAIRVAVHPRTSQFTGVRVPCLTCGANSDEPS